MSSFLRHCLADRDLRAQRKLCALIAGFLDLLEGAPLAPDPDSPLRDRSPLQRVDLLCTVAREAAPAVRHPVCALLPALLVDGDPYRAEIDIRSITAISASKGGRVDALDALPETIGSLYPPAYSFGPYDDAGMKILIEAVFAEFFPDGMRDRHFVVRDAPWCGERIAANSGASRRFALWRRLAGWPGTPRRIQARIRETGLNREALAAIQRQWRVVWAVGAPEVRRTAEPRPPTGRPGPPFSPAGRRRRATRLASGASRCPMAYRRRSRSGWQKFMLGLTSPVWEIPCATSSAESARQRGRRHAMPGRRIAP